MTGRPRILVVDDDPELRDLMSAFLEGQGFAVETAQDAPALYRLLEAAPADVIVLDLMMPGEDGLSVLRKLRGTNCPPVLMLSAMGDDQDRIIGLEVGADDYLAKPCNPRELLARIRALLRRGKPPAGDAEMRPIGRQRLDLVRREIIAEDGHSVPLSDAEFRVLIALLDRPRRVVSRDQLIEATRGHDSEVFDRAVDVTISRLRRKLAQPGLIRTVRSEGYMLVANAI